jgi:hypothetical protein
MGRRKVIINLIFLIVAVYGIYFHFLSGKPSKNNDTPAQVNNGIQSDISAAGQILSEWKVEEAAEYQTALQHNRERNPFENKNINRGYKPGAGIPVRYARPNVSAISLNGSNSCVIANDKIIKIGETVGVWKLVKVESEKALFAGPDSTIWANLGG